MNTFQSIKLNNLRGKFDENQHGDIENQLYNISSYDKPALIFSCQQCYTTELTQNINYFTVIRGTTYCENCYKEHYTELANDGFNNLGNSTIENEIANGCDGWINIISGVYHIGKWTSLNFTPYMDDVRNIKYYTQPEDEKDIIDRLKNRQW